MSILTANLYREEMDSKWKVTVIFYRPSRGDRRETPAVQLEVLSPLCPSPSVVHLLFPDYVSEEQSHQRIQGFHFKRKAPLPLSPSGPHFSQPWPLRQTGTEDTNFAAYAVFRQKALRLELLKYSSIPHYYPQRKRNVGLR